MGYLLSGNSNGSGGSGSAMPLLSIPILVIAWIFDGLWAELLRACPVLLWSLTRVWESGRLCKVAETLTIESVRVIFVSLAGAGVL